jgi:hypothetical protein
MWNSASERAPGAGDRLPRTLTTRPHLSTQVHKFGGVLPLVLRLSKHVLSLVEGDERPPFESLRVSGENTSSYLWWGVLSFRGRRGIPSLLVLLLLAACGDDGERGGSSPVVTATTAVPSVTTAAAPSLTATSASTPTLTPGANATATPTPTRLPSTTPTSTVTVPPTTTGTPTVTFTATPSQTATATVTAEPSSTATPEPTPTPTEACEVAGVICTVAGTGRAAFDGDGRPPLETSFYFPIDMEFDADGRTVIIDWNNIRIRRIAGDGTVETIMGVGFEDFPTDGDLGIDTPLHHPSDIEYDAAGRLFIAGDHVPVVFWLDTDGRVLTLAGTVNYGYAGDGGPAREARLGTPYGVLPDEAGGFYVSDADFHVVRYVNPEGIIDTVAGTGAPGYSGDGGAAREAELASPARLRIGPDGALYFVETRNHVVRRLAPDGTIGTFAGTGQRGYAGDGGPATEADLNTPYDIRFAPNGDAYVADTANNVIRRIDRDGVISTVAGTGEAAFGGDRGDAREARLRRPSAVNFDAGGSLWICDTANHRVRRVWRFLSLYP